LDDINVTLDQFSVNLKMVTKCLYKDKDKAKVMQV